MEFIVVISKDKEQKKWSPIRTSVGDLMQTTERLNKFLENCTWIEDITAIRILPINHEDDLEV